jgi:hypothetical protein
MSFRFLKSRKVYFNALSHVLIPKLLENGVAQQSFHACYYELCDYAGA